MKLPATFPTAPSRRSNRLHYAVRVVVAAVVSASMCACSTAELKGNQAAIEQAREELARAENQHRKDMAAMDALQAEIARLQGLLNSMQGGNADRDRLLAQLAKLQNDYNELLKLTDNRPALPDTINNLLRDLVAQYPDLLEFDERLGMIRFKSDFTFALGSTEVTAKARAALAAFAHILNNEKIIHNEVQVVGHTDDVPISPGGPTAARNPNNWVLSTNRAWAVVDILQSDGVSKSRLEGAGWGDQRPIAANATNYKGNEKNRRVDIYIRPTTVPENLVVSTGTPTTRPVTPPRPVSTRPAIRPPTTRPMTPPGGAPTGVPVPIPG